MPNPQLYASLVAGNPAAPAQLFVAVVDANGNVIGSTFTPPQGRLTLTTLVPVLTTAVATAATVFYTPAQGNVIPLYDGTVIQPTEFAELSNVLANSAVGNAGPAAGAASQNYDMFVWNNAGTLTLTRGPVWTSDVLRSAGTALVMVKGLLLNNVAITNGPAASRGTYVGTVRTDAGGATVSWSLGGSAAGGTPATLNVWNMYNQNTYNPAVSDSNATWTQTTTVIAASDASTGNRISMVRGLDISGIEIYFKERFGTAAAANSLGRIMLGLDSITVAGLAPNASEGYIVNVLAAGDEAITVMASWVGLPGLGFHFISGLQAGDGVNVTTFIGGVNHQIWGRVVA